MSEHPNLKRTVLRLVEPEHALEQAAVPMWQAAMKKVLRKLMSPLFILQIFVVTLTFLKETSLTSAFGLSLFMDAYVLVNNVLIFTRSYFEQLGYGALIPVYSSLALGNPSSNHTVDPQQSALKHPHVVTPEQQELLLVVFNYMMLFATGISAFIAWQHRWISWLMAPTWSGERMDHLLLLVMVVLPCCLLFQMAEMLRTISVQEKRFVLYQVPRILSLSVFIGGFFLLRPALKTGALFIALPVSQLVELVIYALCLHIRWRWQWSTPALKPFLNKLAPVSMTWVIFSLNILVDNFFLSFLPSGEPSAFRYAYVSILIAASLTVVNLQLENLSAINLACLQGHLARMRKLLRETGLQVILWSLPLIAGSIVLAPWLIKLVFQRGAFTAANTLMVAQCFQILILMLPYSALWRVISNCYYTLNLVRSLFVMGLVITLLRAGMEWVGLHLWGMPGIAWMVLGNSYMLLCVLLVFLFRLQEKGGGDKS